MRRFEIHRESLVRLDESGDEGIPAAIHSLLPESESGAEHTLEWLDGLEADIQGRG